VRLHSAGVNVGASAMIADITGLYGSAYMAARLERVPGFAFRLTGLYTQDINIILPDSRFHPIYPSLYGAGVSVHLEQQVSGMLLLEYGFGGVLIKDNTIYRTDNTSSGFFMNAELLIPVAANSSAELFLSVGAEYLLAYSVVNTSYTSFFGGIQYRLKQQ
jgi:hypothetical protein